MKILVVSISAPPKNAPESVQTGRYIHHLKRQNEITLLTNRVSGGWSPADAGLMKYLDGVRRIEVGVLPYRLTVLLKRIFPALFIPDDEADFIWRYRAALRQINFTPELIYSRSAPFSSALLAKKLAEHWQCPWVMHLSDPWVDSPFSKLGAHRASHVAMERSCIARASAVTLTSQKTIEWYAGRYPEFSSKFILSPNVYDPDTLNTTLPDNHGKFRLVFTGRLYGSRTLHAFIRVLKRSMQKYPRLVNDLEVILAGFFDENNIRAVAEADLPNVNYQGPVSLDAAMALQRSAHMLLVIDSLDSDQRFDLFFPSKLLDYMAANRPILAITRSSSTTHDVVHKKFGACFDEAGMADLGAFLNEQIEAFTQNHYPGFAVDKETVLQYSADTNAEKLDQIFKQLAG